MENSIRSGKTIKSEKHLKERAKKLFQEGQHTEAIAYYEKCLKIVEELKGRYSR